MIVLNMKKKTPLFLNQLEFSHWIGFTGKWWAPNYHHLSEMLHGIIRALAIIRALLPVSCSAVSETTTSAIPSISEPLTTGLKWCPVGPTALMVCCLYVYGKLLVLGKASYSFHCRSSVTTGSHSSLSSSHHAIYRLLQETHLLLEIYLLITICFSLFPIVPQFSPWVIPAFQWLGHSEVFGFQFKWPCIKHNSVPTVCLGMWRHG